MWHADSFLVVSPRIARGLRRWRREGRVGLRQLCPLRLESVGVLLAICCLLAGLPARANDEAGILVELNFQSALPQGAYRAEISEAAYGVEILALGRIFRSSFYAGAQFGWYRFRDGQGIAFDQLTDNTFSGHAVLRYQPRWGRWRPYAEAMVGFRYLVATRSFGNSTTFDQSEAVASGGLGVGVDFLLLPSKGPARLGEGMGFTLGLRHLWGSEATYKLVDETEDPAELKSHRSTTNILVPHVGISFHY